MIFSPLGILIFLVGMALTGWAQWKVKSAYGKWSQVGVRSRMTGAELAQRMMYHEGIDDVAIEPIPGQLTDHYDPKAKVVRLSEGVYGSSSVAALGIAAHEIGHVIQDARGYAPMHMRSFVYPAASIGTSMGPYMVIGGLILSSMGMVFGSTLLWVGVFLFAAAVAFTLITLPVEFDASRRALIALNSGGTMESDELAGAKSVLSAAALTYVAAAAVAVMQLAHFILLALSQRD